jgi:hypothetical protein
MDCEIYVIIQPFGGWEILLWNLIEEYRFSTVLLVRVKYYIQVLRKRYPDFTRSPVFRVTEKQGAICGPPPTRDN